MRFAIVLTRQDIFCLRSFNFEDSSVSRYLADYRPRNFLPVHVHKPEGTSLQKCIVPEVTVLSKLIVSRVQVASCARPRDLILLTFCLNMG